jgi:hypothetical protein
MEKYISYFQSVTTIGIVSEGNSFEEAESFSIEKFNSQDLSCGILSQTPFEISDTELIVSNCEMFHSAFGDSSLKDDVKRDILKSHQIEEELFNNIWSSIESKIVENKC